MAGSSVQITPGGPSTQYLANAFRFSWWHHSCSHQLRTETGRYGKIRSNERICSFCNSNKSEDEIHFILDCKAYSKIRDVFFSKIEFRLHNFKSLSHDNLVAHLMNSSDYLINCRLFLFILQWFGLRTEKMDSYQWMNEICNVLKRFTLIGWISN